MNTSKIQLIEKEIEATKAYIQKIELLQGQSANSFERELGSIAISALQKHLKEKILAKAKMKSYESGYVAYTKSEINQFKQDSPYSCLNSEYWHWLDGSNELPHQICWVPIPVSTKDDEFRLYGKLTVKVIPRPEWSNSMAKSETSYIFEVTLVSVVGEYPKIDIITKRINNLPFDISFRDLTVEAGKTVKQIIAENIDSWRLKRWEFEKGLDNLGE